MKGGDDDDDDVWNASAVILDIDSGVYTGRLCKLLLLYVCSETLGYNIPFIFENKQSSLTCICFFLMVWH